MIAPPDRSAGEAARVRQATLTKPVGALGRLEDLACWFAERLDERLPDMPRAAIVVFAADHGVAARSVSAYPREVTAQMLENFARGGAAINVLARLQDADLLVLDVGVASDGSAPEGVRNARVRAGTRDLSEGAAMTLEETRAALDVGRRAAVECVARGARLLIAGDMGIGNTTSAAALICALTGRDATEVVGRGTGIDSPALARKREIVAAAVARVRASSHAEPLAIFAELGGLEIAAIAGFYLEGAQLRAPVLLDGFVTAAAALIAVELDSAVREWMLASHRSAELGHGVALQALGLTPLLDLSLRLGEGTGAALALSLVRAALALHREMATFEAAGVSGPRPSSR